MNNWHSKSIEKIYKDTNSKIEGLSLNEAKLEKTKKESIMILFIYFLIYIN